MAHSYTVIPAPVEVNDRRKQKNNPAGQIGLENKTDKSVL